MPSQDPDDPCYRRLRYVRYADDLLLGFIGPKAEAEAIKHQLRQFLREKLKLELSQEKTLITHARTDAARFLGYEITVQHDNAVITTRRRSINGGIRLRVPRAVIQAKCGLDMRRGQPAHRAWLMNEDDPTIINVYQAEYRGFVQYYLLAGDVHRLNRLHWVMQTSLLKTLAGKHKSNVAVMARRYRAKIDTPHGPRTCLQASIDRPGRKPLVARFGGIPLKRQARAVLTDRPLALVATRRPQLVARLLAGRCELCGNTDRIQVHQVRKLADLATPGQRRRGRW
ncbi:group II intron reverse transcriptase/maturase [Actinophytocola sp.]|uniref:group II intron reverse transcriptase/maturase n=1 Tax=Actinophytocola sp. TaxID=1872138 RepID=UPI0038998DF1